MMVLYYAQAIARITSANLSVTGPNLLSTMHAMSGQFTGVSGLWQVYFFFIKIVPWGQCYSLVNIIVLLL
jgi:hypothetical protein